MSAFLGIGRFRKSGQGTRWKSLFLSGASIRSDGGMGVRHERGEAKIDHLVKDWLRLLLIFRHQAWMTEANARGVDKACRERRVSRMELACRHATRDYLFKYPGHALVLLAHDRPVFSWRLRSIRATFGRTYTVWSVPFRRTRP